MHGFSRDDCTWYCHRCRWWDDLDGGEHMFEDYGQVCTCRGAGVWSKYLREPNVQDTKKFLAIGEAKGFLEMLWSIDYMHWQLKNCPKDLRGIYQGHTKEATIILEAVASHTYGFGMLFLECRVLTTTSTCFNDLLCPGGFVMDNRRHANTLSTAVAKTWDAILPMSSILSRWHLRKTTGQQTKSLCNNAGSS